MLLKVRSSGVLMPLFSLPSGFGIGDMGPGAFAFVDMLRRSGQRVWQILPITPTAVGHGHSPYHSPSAYALNPLLISPDGMAADGWLDKKDIAPPPRNEANRIVYHRAVREKHRLFETAFRNFLHGGEHAPFSAFCRDSAAWLDDFALFSAIRSHLKDLAWNAWPRGLKNRRRDVLRAAAGDLALEMDRHRFLQFIAHGQWRRLKRHCHNSGVSVLGDMPIYVPLDSADVWANPRLFKLDPHGNPSQVSGVPPDYFSNTGQRWGHPVYRWSEHQKTAYQWWFDRLARNLELFDMVRIDHFRGLVAFWEIAAGEKTAVNGKWVDVPSRDFFDRLMRRFVNPPIIAEDLGEITADVREMLKRYGLPGMRVLVFGFSGNPGENPHALHNIPAHAVAYTGTHDTNTVKGWFEAEAGREEKKRLFSYLGRRVSKNGVSWEMVRLALMSRANLAVIPVQDLLGLGAKSRTNRPARTRGNWRWRMTPEQMKAFPERRLLEMVRTCGRD